MFEVKVIVPKHLLDVEAFEKAIMQGIDHLVDDSAQDFASTCSTWSAENKPSIEKEKAHRDGGTITGAARAVGDVYSWNNYDVSRPALVPVKAPFMQFRHSSGWVAKTQRGIIGSGAGANTGPIVRTKRVRAYTRVGRHWDEAIKAKHELRLKEVAEKAVKELSK